MDFKDAFTTIMAAAGSAASIGFLVKLFANSLASAAMKKYELVNAQALESQRVEHQKELQKIKSQLTQLQKEHEIVFSSLYAKREEVVNNLYKLMCEVTLLVANGKKNPDIDISDKSQALIDYFDQHRLYFPKDIADDINQVMNTVYSLSHDDIDETDYEDLFFQLKLQVFDRMEYKFREFMKIEHYR